MRRFLCRIMRYILSVGLLLVWFMYPVLAGTIKGRVYKTLWSNYTTGHEAVWRGYAGMGVSAVKEG
ncbi:MAG: hypothetical protein ACUVRS_01765 [Armatimonadota bacterium]